MLPRDLYRAEAVRALDRYAIDKIGIPGLALMERAGEAAFKLLREKWPAAERITVICGAGNNGGDGYVVARLAHQAGLKVRLLSIGDIARLKGDALSAANAMIADGLDPQAFEGDLEAGDVVVDAILGTGLDREVTGVARSVIEAINRSRVPVLAIDIPSGLHADTGSVMGIATRADATISFIGMKQGLLTGDGPDYCGALYFDDLDVPSEVYETAESSAYRIDVDTLSGLLQPRSRSSHKGHFGHVLVIGGDHGYAGAARMASEAAARVGAGLVSLATRSQHANSICAVRPEIMCHGVDAASDLDALIDQVSVIAIGPGLAQSSWAAGLSARVLETKLPIVVDADGLNLLAADPVNREDWVLTPHPGEAARLLACVTAEVQANRFQSATAIQQRYGGVCVLKGTGTVIADGTGRLAVCSDGNPGMASGGMGDVLTGAIAGLIAQRFTVADAARLGVSIHARAGDLAARDGERGLLATDLMPRIRRLVNPAGMPDDKNR